MGPEDLGVLRWGALGEATRVLRKLHKTMRMWVSGAHRQLDTLTDDETHHGLR